MEQDKLTVNVPKDLNRRWTATARRERRTKTAILTLALEGYLDKSEKDNRKEREK